MCVDLGAGSALEVAGERVGELGLGRDEDDEREGGEYEEEGGGAVMKLIKNWSMSSRNKRRTIRVWQWPSGSARCVGLQTAGSPLWQASTCFPCCRIQERRSASRSRCRAADRTAAVGADCSWR